ncbi:MAG: NUDIX hydrolase [Nanoarchaeota archaeon]|nr:NUDIX hydrolase [Nanoarchaeota archaeon]MBU1322229.1 NUDIX hydrolase [Nanoarchaeota archaeon]MBU1597770.1 NUDIX hydrolase [Nanoarchaeota archaeon]MBU2442034.1 NUDIX hydrolase [Nanoarchaeota archaeon]
MIEDKLTKRQGLKNPYPTVDIIIEYKDRNKEGIILIERKNPPYGLALPGGFAEWGLSLEDNAIKEAKEETSLDVILQNPEAPLCVHSDPERDPRGHTISVTYIAKGRGILKAADDAKKASIYTIEELIDLVKEKNNMAFDHAKTLEKYLKHKGHIK